MNNNKLSHYLTPKGMTLEVFIDLAILLAHTLDVEHQELSYLNCLHPENLLIQPGKNTATLIKESRRDQAYQAPEQYGVINRLPDGRSDLYVLGVILYELLTGHSPYQMKESVDWEIVHLTYAPVPVTRYRKDCPLWIEAILMTLLNKDMDKRYPNALTLQRNLEACRSGSLPSNEKQQLALPSSLNPCDLVSGIHTTHIWTSELTTLRQHWEKVSPEQGNLVWITGEKGSGKSTLITQFIHPLRQTGAVIEGKPDPNASFPFQAISSVVQLLFQLLWSEATAIVQQARTLIEQQCPDWRQMPLLQEELHLLFGQPLSPSSAHLLSDRETEAALLSLIRIFAKLMGPLVLVLDHMELADLQSQTLLQRLSHTEGSIEQALLLIGSRSIDTAIEQREPDKLESLSREQDQILLSPLSYKEVYHYLSSLLEEKSPQVHQLSRLLYEQTGGVLALISSQVEQWIHKRTLEFDASHRWSWSEELLFTSSKMEIDRQQFLVEFGESPQHMQQLLQYASCLHTPFDAQLLLPLTQQSSELLEQRLCEAEDEGYLARTQDNKHYFIHQQIKQFIYEKESSQQQALWHARLAEWMAQQIEADSPRFFEEVLEHWNASPNLSSAQQEERTLCNYKAMQYWLDCGKFGRAKEAARMTIHYIEGHPDSPLRSVLYQSRLSLAYAQSMSDQIEQAKEILHDLLEAPEKPSLTEQTATYSLLIHIYAFNDNLKTIDFHRKALSLFGWEIKFRPAPATMLAEIIRTQMALSRYEDAVERLPTNEEHQYMNLCTLIVNALIPQLIENPTGLLHFFARFVRYGLKKGMNSSFNEVLGTYALLLERFLPQFSHLPGSDKLKSLGRQCLERLENKQVADYWRSLHYQTTSPKQSSEYMKQALHRGMESGDINFANFVWVSLILTSRENLTALEGIMSIFEDQLQPNSNTISLEIYQLTGQYIQALRHPEDTARFIREGLSSEYIPLQAEFDNFESLCKLETAYLAGNYDIADVWAKEVRKTEFIYDHSRIRKQRIYEWLTSISRNEQQQENRHALIQLLRKGLRQIRRWKGLFGEDSSLHELFKAEWSKAHHQPAQAILQYQQAASLARSEQHEWLEGIIHERLSLCYLHDSRNQLLAIVDACSAYAKWGIHFRVSQLQQEYAPLFDAFSQAWENHASNLTLWRREIKLDAAAPTLEPTMDAEMMNAERLSFIRDIPINAISDGQEQINLAQLTDISPIFQSGDILQGLLEQAIRQTGASGGMLVMWSESHPRIMASPSWADSRSYPEKVLRYTATTGTWTLLPDATQSLFAADDYIRSCMPQAMLCAPISIPGFSSMLLYLENRYLSNVFTEKDQLIIELILSRTVYLQLSEPSTIGTDANAHPGSASPSSSAASLIEPLTTREEEILSALAEGLSNKDIALRLGIAETTVKTHASNLFSKLEVKRRGQAVARAKELGLIEL